MEYGRNLGLRIADWGDLKKRKAEIKLSELGVSVANIFTAEAQRTRRVGPTVPVGRWSDCILKLKIGRWGPSALPVAEPSSNGRLKEMNRAAKILVGAGVVVLAGGGRREAENR